MKYLIVTVVSLTLTACATTVPQVKPTAQIDRPSAAYSARPALGRPGMEAVMGKDMATLKRMFGEPRLDVVEVNGRKLQFVGKACVLDAYLYADGKNGGEIVTHVDARRGDGAAVDRASCIDALQRR